MNLQKCCIENKKPKQRYLKKTTTTITKLDLTSFLISFIYRYAIFFCISCFLKRLVSGTIKLAAHVFGAKTNKYT